MDENIDLKYPVSRLKPELVFLSYRGVQKSIKIRDGSDTETIVLSDHNYDP